MSEISNNAEISESKQPEALNYKEIKAEGENNPEKARDFFDKLFSKEIEAEDSSELKNPRQEVMDGKTYYYDDNGKLYRVENELMPNSEYEINGYKYKTDDKGRIVSAEGTVDECNESAETSEQELTLEEKQAIADKVAQEYNESKRPYERAVEKGIEGVKKTENGGVSFAETDKIYITEDGEKCIVKIEATGNRSKDFDKANEAMGLDETPDGYVWHHVDDYNVKDGTITLELVEDEAHNASKPHSGGCAQYDAVNGASYNPPRKGD